MKGLRGCSTAHSRADTLGKTSVPGKTATIVLPVQSRRFVRSLSLSQSHRNSKHFQALQPEPHRSPIPMFRDCLRMLPIQLHRNPSVFSVASEFLHGVTDLRRPTAYPCVMQVSPAALA